MGTEAGAGYFQRCNLLWLTVITVSVSYYTWVIFWPQSVPYQSFGPLGLFTKYLVDHYHGLPRHGYWLSWLIHVGESVYALVLCKHKGITDSQAQFLGSYRLSCLLIDQSTKNTIKGDSKIASPLLQVLLSVGSGFGDDLSVF
ncbi:transmembrane protein 254-like [Psammomys obesus]|uniref:transmembrane protein 254-like n=1 Tax=Psammomys obesus TaxID=48139 RepID=UPI002453626D|nr:transmembrane protein 254-like [Psammomys obesus]